MSGEHGWWPRRPHLEWLGLLALAGLLLLGGAWLLGRRVDVASARRWLVVTATGCVYVLGITGYRHGWAGGEPTSALGLATGITLLRGLLYAAVAGFLLVPPTDPVVRWLPGLVYGLGAVLDFVDGRVARRWGRETGIGARLDLAFDTMGFLVAPLVGVAWGRLPVVYLTLSAARYVFRGGLWWRRWRGRSIYGLPESPLRRRLAAGQMGLITVALLPALPTAVVHPAATLALLPSIGLFLRDWLVVSGRVSRHED